MDVVAAWQVGGVDLRQRPDHDELPVRPGVGGRCQEVEVEAFVDDAVVADARMGDGVLVGRIGDGAAGGAEVAGVDAAGEGVDVVVLVAFRLVEAVPAGEDQVGACEQLRLQGAQARRGAAEGGQFVHAVVDHQAGGQMRRERQHHRGIVPEQRVADAARGDQGVEVVALGGAGCLGAGAFGQDHAGDRQPAGAWQEFEARRGAGLVERFLPEDDRHVVRKAGHEVLRSLVDEIPA